ncbi:PhzF family phenazine biosynthesis protein [Oceanicola sp. 502str15]|uniref:PhzF family phenazine biosynthesis protein n=1 Tax=Oceanicola sp. 502str15 TaxID=2696061 RepID=UPI002094BA6A|nr:PhzF family phenazine biosynthesis protein [Oceanicola sp. 502str15]MCO6382378.1 PhzF family phenazine biosynthesis isomerase [Oceanicola sp. 502str15]
MTPYLTLDVFTSAPFSGNPLAVIPDATALPEAALQRIATEFNYSETTFVFPPEDPENTAKVRIFTPTMEVPFAGHPLIGTAVALARAGHGPEMVLELGVGPIRATATPQEARFTTEVALQVIARPDPALTARALGLPLSALAAPPVMASVGLPFTLTELTSRAALTACAPDTAAFNDGAAAHPSSLDFAQFAYWRDGATIHARMFAPLDNIPEDPATGSASAALGAWLTSQHGAQSLTIHQGDDMGRPSRIGVETTETAVTISGAAVPMMEGRLNI